MTPNSATWPAELVPAWIGAVATSVGVLVALIAILLTYRQLRLTAEQLRQASKREAQDSEDRTRPYVDVDVVLGLAGPPTFDLVLENRGKSTAKNLTLTLEGEGFRAQSDADEIGPALGRFFSEGFDLPPGARRRVFWRFADSDNAVPRGDMGAPESGRIQVDYQWEPAGERESRHFNSNHHYALTDYAKLSPQPATGPTASGTDDAATLKNAVHALRAIAVHVGNTQR